MDAADRDAVLVCLRVGEDSIASVVPGSIQGACFSCDHRLWISVSGQEYAKTATVRYRCIECTIAAATEDPTLLKDSQIVPGAIAEAAAHLRTSRP